MRAQVVGSIAVHIVAGATLLLIRHDGAPASAGHAPSTIEIVEVTPPSVPPRAVSTATTEDGGNARPVRLAAATPRTPRARARAISDARAPTVDDDPRGAITIEHGQPGGDSAGGTGDGTGWGGGRGDGVGLGIGAGGSHAPPPPPPPPPRGEPPPSKARPAKLIYPRRERGVEDGETFIARVTVDDEGYVVGARLVRGFGGRRDDQAASLIFKFRYAPALDDAGRPIRSTLDQNFLVE